MRFAIRVLILTGLVSVVAAQLGEANASIMVADLSTSSFETSERDGPAATDDAGQPVQHPDSERPPRVDDVAPLPPGSSTGTTATGASAGSGPNGCLHETSLLQDDVQIAWFTGEFSLSVPDPPGTELIRPPRR